MLIITGALGFIGSALLWELNQRGIENIIISDFISPHQRPDILMNKKYQQFIPAQDLVDSLMRPVDPLKPPTYIFHLGACSSTTEKNESYLREVNTLFTQSLFDYCALKQIPIQYASSGSVYGNGQQGFSDHTPPELLHPLNPYGWSKINFDTYAINSTQTPTHWYGLRFFNVYGPNEYYKGSMSSVVFKAFQQIKSSGRVQLFKSHKHEYVDGGQLRDFIYVKDITFWMAEMMKNTSRIPSGIYNMGFGKSRTWLDLVTAVFKNMNQPINIEWIDIPEEIRSQYQYVTEARMEKLLQDAQMTPPHWSLENGIQDYVQNYLLQSEAFL